MKIQLPAILHEILAEREKITTQLDDLNISPETYSYLKSELSFLDFRVANLMKHLIETNY